MKSIATVFAGLVTAVLVAAALAGCHRPRAAPPLTSTDRLTLDDYEAIRAALAGDDARGAKKAAAKLVADLTPADEKAPAPSLLAPAKAVADASALDTMRQKFEKLSDAVVPMVRGIDGYYVMRSDLPNTTRGCSARRMSTTRFLASHCIGSAN